MKFLNLGYPQKLYKICKILSYYCFLSKFNTFIRLNTGSIPLSNKNIKEQEKLATKEMKEQKYCTRENKFS